VQSVGQIPVGILLFGGSGYPSSTTFGAFNDLWEFNPSTKEWTWVSGSNTTGASGVYGTQGVASASNTSGARGIDGPAYSWVDTSGNLGFSAATRIAMFGNSARPLKNGHG
jgi:hypothetical protein